MNAKDKPFRDALRKRITAAGTDAKWLDRIAVAQLTKAAKGDTRAAEFIADRLDGKPAQESDININRTYVIRMPAKPENMDEWRKRYSPQPTIQ